MIVSLERATPADADSLVPLSIASFHDDARLYPGLPLDGPPGYDSAAAIAERIDESEYYKILVDGELVGGVNVFEKAPGHVHLDALYIHPDYHNRGIGTQTIRILEATYPAEKWTLDTPGYAIRNRHFYEKFGYINMGETPIEYFTLIAYEKHVPLNPTQPGDTPR